MLSHLLDHFIFSSRRFTTKTKGIVFGVIAFIIAATWWWFKGVSFGITGPVNDHKGLGWRKVCVFVCPPVSLYADIIIIQSWNIYDSL
jgi:dolichyl-phosphate-mannose-protein mannosyltransferase